MVPERHLRQPSIRAIHIYIFVLYIRHKIELLQFMRLFMTNTLIVGQLKKFQAQLFINLILWIPSRLQELYLIMPFKSCTRCLFIFTIYTRLHEYELVLLCSFYDLSKLTLLHGPCKPLIDHKILCHQSNFIYLEQLDDNSHTQNIYIFTPP